MSEAAITFVRDDGDGFPYRVTIVDGIEYRQISGNDGSDEPDQSYSHLTWPEIQASCFYCGCRLSRIAGWPVAYPTKDHLLPKSRGGGDEKANLVDACMRCNRRKFTRTLAEYKAFTGIDVFVGELTR